MSRFTARRAVIGAIFTAAALVAGTGIAHAAFGFDDVNEGDTHAAGIEWLVTNGVTTGCDADSYCPNGSVTRAQMASFMYRLSGNSAVAPSVNAKTLQGLGPAAFVKTPELVNHAEAATNVAFKSVTATCPAGKTVLSGGFNVTENEGGALSNDWYAVADQPTVAKDGWTVSMRTLDAAQHDGFIKVFANCS
jgi:hypothetical protein